MAEPRKAWPSTPDGSISTATGSAWTTSAAFFTTIAQESVSWTSSDSNRNNVPQPLASHPSPLLPRPLLPQMDHAQFSRLVSFIWGIADDVLRDIYVRGRYRNVILPMIVVRRLDADRGRRRAHPVRAPGADAVAVAARGD